MSPHCFITSIFKDNESNEFVPKIFPICNQTFGYFACCFSSGYTLHLDSKWDTYFRLVSAQSLRLISEKIESIEVQQNLTSALIVYLSGWIFLKMSLSSSSGLPLEQDLPFVLIMITDANKWLSLFSWLKCSSWTIELSFWKTGNHTHTFWTNQS